MPQRLLPLGRASAPPGACSVARARSSPCVVRTTTQRSPAGAAGLAPRRVARPAARRLSATASAACASVGGVGHPADPAHPRGAETGDVLRRCRGHCPPRRSAPLLLVLPARSCSASASTAATRLTLSLALPSSAWQIQRHIPLPRGRQRQHPLLEIRPVIPRIAVGHRQRVRIQAPARTPRVTANEVVSTCT